MNEDSNHSGKDLPGGGGGNAEIGFRYSFKNHNQIYYTKSSVAEMNIPMMIHQLTCPAIF